MMIAPLLTETDTAVLSKVSYCVRVSAKRGNTDSHFDRVERRQARGGT